MSDIGDMSDHLEPSRYFFLQALDAASGFAVSELDCGLVSIQQMAKLLNATLTDLDHRGIYLLSESQVRSLEDFCSVKFKGEGYTAALRSWSPGDGLPYRLHPNRELLLMISRKKPLTVLSEVISTKGILEPLPDYLFDPFVEKGDFVKTEYCEPTPLNAFLKGTRIVLYALAKEAWRMDSYIMVRNFAGRFGWNDTLTRLEGTLLGYEEWQNDAFIASLRAHTSTT